MPSMVEESARVAQSQRNGGQRVQQELAAALRAVRPNLLDEAATKAWYALIRYHTDNLQLNRSQLHAFCNDAGVPD